MSILVVMVLNVPSLIVSSTSIHWWILSIYATSRIRQAMCSPPCRWDQITVQTPNLTSCVNCPKCPIGMGLSPQCGSYVDSSVRIECVPCVSGVSYSTSSDISSCSPCSICGENQENLRPCTVDRNSACGKCKRGYYQEPIVYDCWPCSKCCPNSTDDDLVPACLDQGLPRERSCTLDTRNRNCPEVEPYSKSQKNIITKTPLVKNVTDEILNGSRVSDGDASGKVIVRIDLLILVLLGVMFIVISLAVGIIAFLVSSRCHVRACATPQATNLRVARDSGDHEPLPPAQHLLLSENCQKTAVFSV
ncbi:tumor necrosis factor receptor superfamily member 10B [Nematostella vectensis]|uniref:tumor necrosis factor receptor superfamily member 10B n=1 Tax=Nematostella vectensis TaxID=45351 RepID=UPI00138FEDE5|nr:tumor necrosis factor receptor superfamily member 10B [Nematostella vectensis]